VWDRDCGFCRSWIERWRATTGDRINYAPFQEVADNFPEIPSEDFERAVQLIDADGTVSSGADAVCRTLAVVPRLAWIAWLYRRVPGVAPVADVSYRVVATNRRLFSRLMPAATYALAGDWFLRGLGVIYLIAFVSLGLQIHGLIGSDGILPAARFLDAVHAHCGAAAYRLLPTLAWFGAGDGALTALWVAGAIAALALIVGVARPVAAVSAWGVYLSLAGVSRDFLSFQWDGLLLEAGLLAIFLLPWGRRREVGSSRAPSTAVVWLYRWLLFRLMFSSGLVKLLSGDAAWRSLHAMRFHYQTQPLPTPLAWWANLLPAPVQDLTTLLVLVIELAVPFLLFAPRRLRMTAGGVLIALQVLICLTGNYAFFNVLTILLCLLLFDDRALRRLLPVRRQPLPSGLALGNWPSALLRGSVLALVAVASVCVMVVTVRPGRPAPRLVASVLGTVAPLRSVNSYGLFAVMTTERPEIVIEGSDDGVTWRPYGFRWKPGDLHRRPRFVAPYQPRLDWQIWFAALGSYRTTPWFGQLLERLLEGSPPVLSLLAINPFPDAPPRMVRAVLYRYRFTTPEERAATGNWWARERLGLYSPVLERPRFRGSGQAAASSPRLD
jgi:predicted DCC family thiol-disulfide oxidoreductase YuxK